MTIPNGDSRGAQSSQCQALLGKESQALLPHPVLISISAPTPLLSYLHGVMQLLGLISVLWVREGHHELLKLATKL